MTELEYMSPEAAREKILIAEKHIDIAQLKLEFFRYLLHLKKSDQYSDDIGTAAGAVAAFIDFLENE